MLAIKTDRDNACSSAHAITISDYIYIWYDEWCCFIYMHIVWIMIAYVFFMHASKFVINKYKYCTFQNIIEFGYPNILQLKRLPLDNLFKFKVIFRLTDLL